MSPAGHGPGLVLVNGAIWTGSDEVEALAIRGDRVVAVGSKEEAEAAVGRDARTIDLGGHRVVPGLIDSHLHFLRAGIHWGDVVRWDDVDTLGEGLSRIGEAASAVTDGTWIRVLGGWHPHRFPERRGPTSEELDAAAPEHPVYVQLLYEEAYLNSFGARIALDRADPRGGEFERDEGGRPTGTIRGVGAFAAVLQSIPQPAQSAQEASFKALVAECSRLGLTGIVDPAGFGVTPGSYEGLLQVWRSGALDLRVRLYLMPWERGSEVEQVRYWVENVEPGEGDGWLRYVGLGEIFAYGCHDLEGLESFPVTDAARRDLREITSLLARSRWPGHIHAILDSTIDAILDVWTEVAEDVGGLPRFSLAHAEFIGERNLRRAKDLGIGIAIQNRLMFRAADSVAAWGRAAVSAAPPLRDILDLEIPLGAGTDGTVASAMNPWYSIRWLVSGRSLDGAPPRAERHRLSRQEALGAYTSGSAWFSLEEGTRGTLGTGMLADLAVLTQDFFTVEEDEIPGIRALLTMVGGRIVHADGPFADLLT